MQQVYNTHKLFWRCHCYLDAQPIQFSLLNLHSFVKIS